VLLDRQVLEQVRLVGMEREPSLRLDRILDDDVAVACTRPAVGRRMPASDRSVVVLPAPLAR